MLKTMGQKLGHSDLWLDNQNLTGLCVRFWMIVDVCAKFREIPRVFLKFHIEHKAQT